MGTGLRHQLLRSFFGVGAMHAFAIPIGFAINVLLARTLGPDSFGQYSFVWAVMTLLALPGAGGVPQLLTRQVAAYAHSREWGLYRGVLRAAMGWVIAISGAVYLAYVTFTPFSKTRIGESKWQLLGIALFLVPLQGLNAVRNGAIKGLGFPAQAEMPTKLIQPVMLLTGMGLLAWWGQLTAGTALWAQMVVAAITLVVASALFVKHRPEASIGERPLFRIREWSSSLLPFTLIAMVGTFNAQIGVVLLGAMGSDEAVAALRVADRGAQFVATSLMLVNMVISPHVVRTYHAGEAAKLQRLSRQSARGAFAIAVVVAFALIVFGKPLIRIAFGSDYAGSAYLPMTILVAGQLFNVALGSVGILLMMSGHEKATLGGQVAGLVVTVLAAIALIPLYEATGAAIAVTCGLVVWNIVLGLAVYKYLRIKPGIL